MPKLAMFASFTHLFHHHRSTRVRATEAPPPPTMASSLVQFTPLSSLTHPSFWHKLSELKLDVLKLSDDQIEVTGSYTPGRLIKDREHAGAFIGMNGSVAVEESSFAGDVKCVEFAFSRLTNANGLVDRVPTGSVAAKGVAKNYNTIEDFKSADKTKLFNEAADRVC